MTTRVVSGLELVRDQSEFKLKGGGVEEKLGGPEIF